MNKTPKYAFNGLRSIDLNGLRFSCTGCDESMKGLYAFLQAVRGNVNRYMNVNSFARLLVISCVPLLAATITFAQDGPQTRSITSDDFASQRPAAAKVPGNKGRSVGATRVTPKYVRRVATAVSW